MNSLPAYDLSELRVLVVDDNKNMRAIVGEALRALGVRKIHEAEDGADALKLLQTAAADIVICDWNMSPIDGIEFTRMLRNASDTKNPYVPVIMLTGHTEYSRVVEARDCGIHEFLAKPISPKALYRRIVSIIRNPRDFIKTRTFFGPDRRRRAVEMIGTDRRKNSKPEAVKDSGLSPEEVEALLKG